MAKIDEEINEILPIPLNWYYLILDKKSKRPDYSVIVGLAFLAELHFVSQENNKDYMKFFPEHSLELLNDIYKSAGEYKNAEKYSFFCHVLKNPNFLENKEIGFLAAFLLSEFFAKLVDPSSSNKIFIDKKEILELFNETPQRIRKAIEFLIKIKLKNTDIKINKENIEITFLKEMQEHMT